MTNDPAGLIAQARARSHWLTGASTRVLTRSKEYLVADAALFDALADALTLALGTPRRRRPDLFIEFWDVPCQDCGGTNQFGLGVNPAASSAWWHESGPLEHCANCGMPLPDEHVTAEALRTLRKEEP